MKATQCCRRFPISLTPVKEPIGHPNWIYELKHNGFGGVLYVDRDQA